MSVKFRDPAGRMHDAGFCDRNLNLLAHAQAIELEIGSRCGGHGDCGGDRVQLTPETSSGSRFSPPTEHEREHFGAAELLAGWRLACQCFPQVSDDEILAVVPSPPPAPASEDAPK